MKISYDIIQKLAFGVEYIEAQETRVIFSRFSKDERHALNYGMDKSFATAGVRLEFETDSRYLRVAVCTEKANPERRNFYSFDVCVNGQLIGQIKNFDADPLFPYPEYPLSDREQTFFLGIGAKKICIYFPWSVQGMIREIEVDDGASVVPVVKKRKILMYGDSITQGYDAGKSSASYASKLTDQLDADGINKGIGGSIFLPALATVKGNISSPDLVTVAYGTNEWRGSEYQPFKERCESFFENLVKNYPNTPVVVISPIWRADCAENHKLGDFSTVADVLHKVSAGYRQLHFIDGIDFVPKDTAFFRDGYLHPNDEGFEKFADALIKNIQKLL